MTGTGSNTVLSPSQALMTRSFGRIVLGALLVGSPVSCYQAGDNDDGAAAGGAGGATASKGGSVGKGGSGASTNTSGAGGSGADDSGGKGGTPNTAGTGGADQTGGDGGVAGTAGTGGTTGLSCGDPLTLDVTGWVDVSSNGCGIQGPWHWFKDNAGTIVSDAVADTPPYRAGSGMCLQGSTIVDEAFLAYGATIGLNLSEAPDGTPLPFNASQHGIVGFEVTLSGSWTQELRLGFPSVVPSTDAAPFVLVGNTGPGVYIASLAAAVVPADWNVPNAGQAADPAAIAAVHLAIAGGASAAPFDVCITSLRPIVN